MNDTLKAIAASLLMEQVLVPRYDLKPKKPQNEATPGFDYGQDGYDPNKCNVGFNEETGKIEIEVKGLAEPKSKEAQRICKEDINEIIATFVKDRPAIERGLFDHEMIPEELTQVRMGKIVKEMYPGRDADDVEAIRQYAITAFNLTQQAKEAILLEPETPNPRGGDGEPSPNTAFVDGVRKFLSVKDIDIDLIDRINPFGAAYAILSKAMTEESLRQVAAVISAKKMKLSPDEARELALRARQFKKERGRFPSATAADPWEVKMAEGAAAFVRFKDEGRYE